MSFLEPVSSIKVYQMDRDIKQGKIAFSLVSRSNAIGKSSLEVFLKVVSLMERTDSNSMVNHQEDLREQTGTVVVHVDSLDCPDVCSLGMQ